MERVRLVARAVVALLAAAAAPAALFAVLTGSFFFFVVAFAVALAHALVLGLPIFLLLRAKRWVNAMSAMASGFIVGAASLAIEAAQGHIDRTIIPGVLVMGGCGAIGGLAFYAVWKFLDDALDHRDAAERA